jgi:hypothetical protein
MLVGILAHPLRPPRWSLVLEQLPTSVEGLEDKADVVVTFDRGGASMILDLAAW